MQELITKFKEMPTKNKLAIGLMLLLTIAVVIEYYPESDSSMQLTQSVPKSSSKNSTQTANQTSKAIANSTQLKPQKMSRTQIAATQDLMQKLKKYPQGIYLTPVANEQEIQKIADAASLKIEKIEQQNNSWLLTGTSEDFAKLVNFVNLALHKGLQSQDANFVMADKSWQFTLVLKHINQ